MTSSRSYSRAAVDALVACLRDAQDSGSARGADMVHSVPTAELLDAASYHGASGHLWRALNGSAAAPEALREELRARYDAAVRHHLAVTWDLRRLTPVLDGSGARWAVVKGPALADLVYGDAGTRSYADLDVLVEPARFDAVLEALRAAGMEPLDRNWRVIRRSMRGELHFTLSSGVPLDLHWHLVNMYRGSIAIDTRAMLARAVRRQFAGVEAPVLEPTDALLHLALHGTLSGADRLMWMQDIAMSVRRQPPEWDMLVDRARAWHVAAPVGFMLRRTRRVLGAPIPVDAAEALVGRPYLAIASIVERLSPWQTAKGRVTSPHLLLTRSMGLGLPRTAGWLLARTVRHFDPGEPWRSSNFRPSGGRADFDAFVRAVVRSGRTAS